MEMKLATFETPKCSQEQPIFRKIGTFSNIFSYQCKLNFSLFDIKKIKAANIENRSTVKKQSFV